MFVCILIVLLDSIRLEEGSESYILSTHGSKQNGQLCIGHCSANCKHLLTYTG